MQGPRAEATVAALAADDPTRLRYYRFAVGEVAGVRCIVSRTGYTGEDGFELYLAPDGAPAVWDALLEAGREDLLHSVVTALPQARAAD